MNWVVYSVMKIHMDLLSVATVLFSIPYPHIGPFPAASFLAVPHALLLLFSSSGILTIKTHGMNLTVTLSRGG